MEKKYDEGNSMSSPSSEEEEEEGRSRTFPALKQYCLELLELLQNPNKNSNKTLPQLHQLLRRSPASALQPFFDYTLFPLLLLLDAAISCRSQSNVQSEEISTEMSALKRPHKVSDIVAEGVLQCLEELLKKCCLGSVDQFVVLLKKLTYGALLSPSEAAEEFRGGVIRCFRALISTLFLCPDQSCLCKQSKGWPTLLVNSDLESPPASFSEDGSASEECLLAFLQSQSVSAAVGHWLSLLLKSADVEAARGHRGSAKLRVEAFLALRILVAKVGTADALAFFLPGVVSQFGKVLHVSKTMSSGAAGSVEAMDQAIRGLAEFLMIVLEDNANLAAVDESAGDSRFSNSGRSPIAFLEELRHLPVAKWDQSELVIKDLSEKVVDSTHKPGLKGKESMKYDVLGSLHVNRSKDWLSKTSVHVDKLLSTTFPHLCVHPAKRVRQGLLAAVKGLLSKCSYTLKESRLMLMECLCVLVCDDCEDVSAAAQDFLRYLFSSSGKSCISQDVAEIFKRLFEKLPEVVLGREETLAVSHVQKLFVLIYFSGPQLVTDHLLQSPVVAARFFDTFALCLSQNSVFAGSLDKLLLERPSSVGYLRSITEMKNTSSIVSDNKSIKDSNASRDSNPSGMQSKSTLFPLENLQNEYTLPRMPPWFASIGSQKLYEAFAWVLRLVGLSLVADSQSEGCLSIIKDIPLGYLRKLVSEVRMKEYSKERWQSWYSRTGSGQIVRQSSTAACILNEMIFGLSDQAVDTFAKVFHKTYLSGGETEEDSAGRDSNRHYEIQSDVPAVWKGCLGKGARGQLIDCIGSILHEYLSPEVWNLPLEPKFSQQSDMEAGDVTFHFLQDNAMLHQVIIDGIGIFNVCLQADFSLHGFLHSSLYVLLENLICSNFQIRRASDAVLHIISATSGYPTVGHLVLANSDYVIDSICRQLRHLDLNPHVPSVLAAMLSYIGVAHKILPLLEEPMRSVSQELEILGRHEHPHLTISFLKAVAEIAKASKLESSLLPTRAESYFRHVNSKLSSVEKGTRKEPESSKSFVDSDVYMDPMESEVGKCSNDVDMHVEQCESLLFKLNETKRYRRSVGSVIGSCLIAATPLLASSMQAACLIALDIVEDGILALSKVEEAYRHEKEISKVIRQAAELYSLHNLCDALDAEEDGAEENRLLPAMNKIWPFFIACFQNRNPVAVCRCSAVISSAVQICGGDFFSRRFHTDGPHLWKVLSTSPYQKKPANSKEERISLQLPYRGTSSSSRDSRAEVSDLKVQVAVLNMIADLSQNIKSASALEAVLKKVAGLVVGIACSSVVGLRDASRNALVGLSSMDPDLVWLLVADVYYSMKKNDLPSRPLADLPEICQLLPPPSSPKDYLFVQYGGQSNGFDIDFTSVETIFKKLS